MNRGVGAATAFARLYHRWFDDPLALADESARQAHAVVGERVADVLALWDERTLLAPRHADRPAPRSMRPCRVRDARAAHRAALRRRRHRSAHGGVGMFAALERFRPCSYAIDRTVVDIELETDEKGLLVGAQVALDDGGRIALGGRAVRALPCAV